MSTATPKAGQPVTKDNPSTEPTSNPFDTLFDGDESEDEWWDEEDSTISTIQKPATAARVTQWPRTLENTGVGVIPKPARTSTRKVDKRCSVQKPTRDKSKGRQRKQNAKAGIKVVTNFSRQQGPAPQPVQLQPSKTMPQMGCFVDLAALQALNGESTQPSGGFWKKKKGLTRAGDTMPTISRNERNALERRASRGLVPSPIKVTEDLSPNDRPIVIGISIPSSDMNEHTLSPQTATSDTSKIVRSYEHRTQTAHTPETPTIIITPAQESPSWSPLDMNGASPSRRPRAASSIYSQGPQNAMGIYTDRDAPPVPQMPASVLEDERQRIAAQRSYFSPDSEDGTTWGDEEAEHRSPSKSRVVSSCTVFEEDENPGIARAGRAVSISAKSAKHASISTVATRRRSKGWWNYITTPFLTRSNTVATRGVFDDQQPPALPSLALAAAKAQEVERDGSSWEKQFSPLTPETTTSERPESWWHSASKDEDAKDSKFAETSPVLQETRHKPQPSSATIPFVLSEVAGIGGSASSRASFDNTEPLDRSMTGTSIARSASGLSSTDREVPIVADAPSITSLQSNNPYVQPRLGDLSDSSNHIRSATRQVIQPIRAAVVQAPSRPQQPQQSPGDAPPPPYSPSPSRMPRYRAILPPGHSSNLQYPVSPGPLSPGMQQAMSGGVGIPMSNVPLTPPPRRPINLNSGYPAELPAREPALPFVTEFLQPPSKKARKAEAKRRRHEKEDAIARRAGGWWRGRGCISDRGCYGRTGAEGRKRRRWYIGLITGFLSMMILVIVLATTLHRKSNTVIGPSQWLNLTGFPSIFTGLSTVAAPVNIVTNTGCVFPTTQWSCDLPKELQSSVSPNQPNQPNFLLNIQWDNSSSTNATFSNVTGNPHLVTRAGNPVSAGLFIKMMLLKARQIVTFLPNPAPPSYAEEFFLGNTTDGIVSVNKAGEPTPFYISFLQPTNSSLNTKRQILERQSTDPFPNVTDFIPAPSLNSDGTAAPANLLPLPTQQPIRLYDRGLATEHYGFYTYFDRSIFLKSITKLNNTNTADGEVPDDENGGSTESEAAFRCTWAQTRFLVQMWTRMNSTAQINNSTGVVASSPGTDFTQPGSFPYPITITTDRHGGDPALKMLYCYEMNNREGLVASSGQINAENRGFGGTVVNPAPNVFSNTSDPALGGFDGGTGGCSCQWSNFHPITNT